MEELLNSETELNLFEGMDGFEKFNPLDDSSLLAILDDLEEGTLLSLLGDESLVSEVSSEMNTKSFPQIEMEPVSQERDIEDLCAILLNEELPPLQNNNEKPDNPSPAISTQTKANDTISKPLNTMKRPISDSSLESPLKRARLDPEELLSSIRHDHSYAAPVCHVTSEKAGKSHRMSPGSSSDEEGSLSDAGMLYQCGLH